MTEYIAKLMELEHLLLKGKQELQEIIEILEKLDFDRKKID